jgi:hypothetical protein
MFTALESYRRSPADGSPAVNGRGNRRSTSRITPPASSSISMGADGGAFEGSEGGTYLCLTCAGTGDNWGLQETRDCGADVVCCCLLSLPLFEL